MNQKKLTQTYKKFENIKHRGKNGQEFWLASELMREFGYEKKDKFTKLIFRAQNACKKSGFKVQNHFPHVGKMVQLGSGAKRAVFDYNLSRYACYLIAQNGDPRKKEQIALAQTYFAFQTRKQEVRQNKFAQLERLLAREKLSKTEKRFAGVLFEKGINGRKLAIIKSDGDAALFGGKNTKSMKKHLKISKGRPLADFLPTITIKAKDLAAEMTTFKTEEEDTKKSHIIRNNHVTHNVGVRRALTDENIYPELLPPEEDIKKLKRMVENGNKKLL